MTKEQRIAHRAAQGGANISWAQGAGNGSNKMTGAGVNSAIGGVMDLAGAAAPILSSINDNDRMDDRGIITHKVNTGANVMSMGAAGAKAGMMFGPWGAAIGAGVGALAGGVMSIIDKNNQPTLGETIAKNNQFNLQQNIKSIRSNDTFAQQAQAAESGLQDVAETKQIEVEKDEIVLRKVGKIYKKVADFKGGKSHAQGGEDYIAEEGDVIFPGKKRNAVQAALRTRNWKRLESMRAQLPPDTGNSQFPDGTKGIEPPSKLNKFNKKNRAAWKEKYGHDTAYFMQYLNKTDPSSGKKFKDLILEVAESSGVDPNFLANTMLAEGMESYKFQEDYDKEYENYKNAPTGEYDRPSLTKEEYFAEDGLSYKTNEVSGVNYMGLDTIGDVKDKLIKNGYLTSEDYDSYVSEADPYTNELGQAVNSAIFKDLPSALKTSAAFVKSTQDSVDDWAKGEGIDMSPKQRMFFHNIAYNAGEGNARKMARSYNESGYLKDDSFLDKRPSESWKQPYKHATRRMSAMQGMHNEDLLQSSMLSTRSTQKQASELKPMDMKPIQTPNLFEPELNSVLPKTDAIAFDAKPKYAKGSSGISTEPPKKRVIDRRHKVPKANYGKRKTTDTIIIHRTAGSGNFDPKSTRLTEEGLGAHFTINPDGSIDQVGDINAKMGHAGPDWNGRSIGIEIVGEHLGGLNNEITDKVGQWADMTDSQKETLKELTGTLVNNYNIDPNKGIIDHYTATLVGKGGKGTTKGYGKTANEGTNARKYVVDYLNSDEYKTNPPTGYNLEIASADAGVKEAKKAIAPATGPEAEVPSMLPEGMPKAPTAEMKAPNDDVLPGVGRDNSILRPETQELLEEDNRGYYSAGSITGKKALKKLGDKISRAEALDAENRKSGGFLDSMASALSIGSGGGPLGASPGGMMGHGATGTAVSEVFGLNRVTGGKPTQISGFKNNGNGKKLKREAEAFYEFLKHDAEGEAGTWLVGDAFRAYDGFRAKIFGSDENISYKISDALSGVSAENAEAAINEAKKRGIISNLGSEYLWDVTANSGDFKSLQHSAGEQIDLASVADPRAWVGLAKLTIKGAKGTKNLIKDAAKLATTKGRRALNIKRLSNKRLKAVSNSPTQARKLDDELVSASSNYQGQESADELLALRDKVGTAIGDINVSLPKWGQVVEAVKAVKDKVALVPAKFRSVLTGRSIEDAARMSDELLALTGKTQKEMLNMSKADVGKLIQSKLDDIADNVSKLAKDKNVAMDSYTKAKDSHTAMEAELTALRKGKAEPIVVARLEKELQETRNALKGHAKRVKETTTAQEAALEDVLRTEEFMASDEYGDKFRTVMKLEEDWQRKIANVDKADADLGVLAMEQEGLIKRRNAIAKSQPFKKASAIASYAVDVAEAKKARKTALSNQQSATAKLNQAKGRMPGDIDKVKADFDAKVPKLMEAISKDAELLDMWKQAGKGGVKIAKVLDLAYDKFADHDIEPRTVAEPLIQETSPEGSTPSTNPDDIDFVPIAPNPDEGSGDIEPQGTEDTEFDINDTINADSFEKWKDSKEPNPFKDKKGNVMDKISGGFSELASYAPAMYNIVKGLEDPEKITRRFVTPQTRKYENMSQPQLNAIENAFTGALGNARNMSGGLMSNFRANTEQAWADKIARTAQVNAIEAQRADQIAAGNIVTRNNADRINTDTNQKADIMDMQSKAATNSFLAQGVQDVANISSMKTRDANANKSQDMMMEMIKANRPWDN